MSELEDPNVVLRRALNIDPNASLEDAVDAVRRLHADMLNIRANTQQAHKLAREEQQLADRARDELKGLQRVIAELEEARKGNVQLVQVVANGPQQWRCSGCGKSFEGAKPSPSKWHTVKDCLDYQYAKHAEREEAEEEKEESEAAELRAKIESQQAFEKRLRESNESLVQRLTATQHEKYKLEKQVKLLKKAAKAAKAAEAAKAATTAEDNSESPAVSAVPESGAQAAIAQVCDELKAMLLEKNRAYGNSALEPVRVFSQASPVEQLLVRLDDKLSRLARGSGAGEDVVLDLMGYLVLLRVAQKRGAV
jgi:hypothetical protein